MMMMLRSLLLAALLSPVSAQFTCTFAGAKDSTSCTEVTDDSSEHCVWCSVGGGDTQEQDREQEQELNAFGFCVAEAQAEAMEQSIPNMHCDRYSSDDDATPSTDDDTSPAADDDTTPTDDAIPDNYWTCLKEKNASTCSTAGCTWCDTKGGFGLCMTGPSAESAADSDWFTCKKNENEEETLQDPYDPSCLLAYLQDSSKDACIAAADADGNACEFCTLQGALDLCLTSEQAEMGEQLGITCAEDVIDESDPFDTSCVEAYWFNQSEEKCNAAVDQEGNACQVCRLPGSFVACLTTDQANIGQQLGMECDAHDVEVMVEDPYETACTLAYVMDPSKEACVAAVDTDGSACEYCTLQGAFNLCLTSEQAETGEQMGVTCDAEDKVAVPDDFFECLENYQEDGCRSSSCTWCNTEVGMGFCLSPAVADATKECKFFDCEFGNEKKVADIYDPVCFTAGMQNDPEQDSATLCGATTGSDGDACVWCDAAGVFGLCLSSEQASAASQFLQCDAVAAVATTE